MSVGPGKILVYRAFDQGDKPRPFVKEKAKPQRSPAEPSAESTGIGSANKHKQSSAVSQQKIVPRKSVPAPGRIRVMLAPNEHQKRRLTQLFQAPNALARILRSYPERIIGPAEASLFLLRNKRELDGYLEPRAREGSIDLLTELLVQWSGDPPEWVGIDFDDVSLTAEQRVYLPLDGLRDVPMKRPEDLQHRRKGLRYRQPFTVFEEDQTFFVAFDLELPGSPRSTVNVAPPRPGSVAVPELKLAPGTPMPYIAGSRHRAKEPRQRILYSKFSGVFRGGIGAMNWGALSGYGVGGGLPSLGKRSR